MRARPVDLAARPGGADRNSRSRCQAQLREARSVIPDPKCAQPTRRRSGTERRDRTTPAFRRPLSGGVNTPRRPQDTACWTSAPLLSPEPHVLLANQRRRSLCPDHDHAVAIANIAARRASIRSLRPEGPVPSDAPVGGDPSEDWTAMRGKRAQGDREHSTGGSSMRPVLARRPNRASSSESAASGAHAAGIG